MADLRFARHTNAILNALPHWFAIRKQSKDSIGARFLNVAGLELDDARYVIDYAYQQCYIDQADISQVDFCYKAIIPMPYRGSEIKRVKANDIFLYKADTLKEFFGIDQHGIDDVNLHSFESWYCDTIRNIIYVRQKFNVDAVHDNGKIRLFFGKDENEQEIVLRLIPHQVWNFFDELGALVSCPRLPEEPNVEYKARIMDVFENKANASRDGLINGIGRELAIRRRLLWYETDRDLELQDQMIVLNSIKVNKEYFPQDRIFLSDVGTVVLKSDGKKTKPHYVTYVYGLEMHQLWNIKEPEYVYGEKDYTLQPKGNSDKIVDKKLYNELFTVEGKAKERLRQYIRILNSETPIFWNNFHWNEHYWDQNEQGVSGVGFIPHLYNGSIRGFMNYKPEKKNGLR